MKLKFLTFLLIVTCLSGCKKDKKANNTDAVIENKKEPDLKITPINHASLVMEYKGSTIYVDPTGGVEAYETFKLADFVVITDIHGDHMNLKTLEALDLSKSKIIVPEAVYSKLPENLAASAVVINNDETKDFDVFSLKAIPMYNLRQEALKFHTKGRGNGYVFDFGYEEIYISGDTEDISEMRALEGIDKAFICMNLPYTMTVESAADAVLEFKPKQVYPYHYRNAEGFSDINKFKQLINKDNKDIEVVQLDWYPKK